MSPYLVDELREGDTIELRGPIGGYFVWQDAHSGPVLLLAGGSGSCRCARCCAIAPRAPRPPVRLLYSTRSPAELIYREELRRSTDVDVRLIYTREWPEGWEGHRGRIDAALLAAGPGRPRAADHLHLRAQRLRRDRRECARRERARRR